MNAEKTIIMPALSGKLKKLLSVVITVCMLVGILSCSAVVADAAGAAVNATEVTIYALDDWAKEYISIPAEYPQSFQLAVSGADSVSYYCGDRHAQVSDSGLITPYVETFYWYGSYGYSYRLPDGEPTDITNDVMYGTSTVYVIADSQTIKVQVTVKDYAEVYANRVMDEYIAENIEPSMTTYEKLSRVGAFIGGYEYSVYQQSPEGMIITGGGDCWASANTVVAMAEKLGLDAWQRNGNRDPGAGSGHMNAMVYDGSKYYEVEAGYYMPVPRSYYVKERDSLFSYKYDSTYGGITVYQYDGKTAPEKLEVPKTIDGETVTSIGDYFISGREEVTEIVLPDTVCEIGKSAFSSCIGLQSIALPDSLKSIGDFAFANCVSLTDIKSGGDYTAVDGVIYHGDTLVFAPAVASLSIPSGVTEIAPYAFYYNKNIKKVTVPEAVTKIGEGAFGDCESLTDVSIKGEGLKEIGDFVVAYSPLKELAIPASADTFGEYMMKYADSTTLVVAEGSHAEQYAKENNISYRISSGTLVGDVNGDGEVNNRDAVILDRFISGWESYADKIANEDAADLTRDGAVNNRDAVALDRYIAGWDGYDRYIVTV